MSTDVYLDVNIENSEKYHEVDEQLPKNEKYNTIRIGHLGVFQNCDFNLLEWLKHYSKVFVVLTEKSIDTIVSMSGFYNDKVKEWQEEQMNVNRWHQTGWELPLEDIPNVYELYNFLLNYIGSTWEIRVD